MPRFSLAAAAAVALLLSLCGCQHHDSECENAIYHWKNDLSPEKPEKQFLKDHNIKRIYLRLFDVVSDPNFGAVPNNNMYLYGSDLPKGINIVPTIFITLEALREMEGREDELADNIYKYLTAWIKDEEIENIDEIQLDCDWTQSSRDSFFALCEQMTRKARANGMKISSTIRLHQLSQPAPPVDSGVLMVYNVGELKNPDETNSILRADIVERYLSKAPKYPLPLDVAYPIFSWGVVFDSSEFQRIVRLKEPIDSMPDLKHLHDNIYEIINPYLSERLFGQSYHQTLRHEFVTPQTLTEVKGIVERYLGGRPHRVILYHLDEATISKYSTAEIASFYE